MKLALPQNRSLDSNPCLDFASSRYWRLYASMYRIQCLRPSPEMQQTCVKLARQNNQICKSTLLKQNAPQVVPLPPRLWWKLGGQDIVQSRVQDLVKRYRPRMFRPMVNLCPKYNTANTTMPMYDVIKVAVSQWPLTKTLKPLRSSRNVNVMPLTRDAHGWKRER